MELIFRSTDWDRMRTHVHGHAPLEACGLLAGKNNRVQAVLLVGNQAQSRVRFRMDPKEQLKAFDWIESNRLELVGIFHSHPDGPENVSETDIEEAAYNVPQIVWSRTNGDWVARGFWIEGRRITEVRLQVIND